MSNDSTHVLATTATTTTVLSSPIAATVENEQDLASQLVKQETETEALKVATASQPQPEQPPIQEAVEKKPKDTAMIEATIDTNNNNINNETSTLIKIEEANEVQADDTLVKPPLQTSTTVALPTQQEQSTNIQPITTTTNTNESSLSTIILDTAVTPNTTASPSPRPVTTTNVASTAVATPTTDAVISTTPTATTVSNATINTPTNDTATTTSLPAATPTNVIATPAASAAATPITTNNVTPTPSATTTPTPTPSTLNTSNTTSAPLSTTATATPTPAPVPVPTTTFEEIQKQLKNTLDHVEQRNMVSGFQTLSKATGAVVDHCEQLGLTSDDHPYNAIDREQFWAGLNNCWLYALAQRHEPSSDAERLTDQHLYSLREMVVSWADKLERFGLVDYEMGWWEADILAAIDGILAMNYAAAQAAAQAVVAQAAAALFGSEEVNM